MLNLFRRCQAAYKHIAFIPLIMSSANKFYLSLVMFTSTAQTLFCSMPYTILILPFLTSPIKAAQLAYLILKPKLFFTVRHWLQTGVSAIVITSYLVYIIAVNTNQAT